MDTIQLSKANKCDAMEVASNVQFRDVDETEILRRNVNRPVSESWSYFYVSMSILTAVVEPYRIAFGTNPGRITLLSASGCLSAMLDFVFSLDLIICMFQLYFDDNQRFMESKKFWIKLLGILPISEIAILLADQGGEDPHLSLFFSLLHLFRLIRLYRVYQFYKYLLYNTEIPLTEKPGLCVGIMFLWIHLGGCSIYFLGRFDGFAGREWMDPGALDMPEWERYIMAWYWCNVLFTSPRYASSVNTADAIFQILYKFASALIWLWMTGFTNYIHDAMGSCIKSLRAKRAGRPHSN